MSSEEPQNIELLQLELEREKHRDEIQFKRDELELRRAEEQRAKWHSPLLLAVIAAIIGLLSNAAVAWLNGSSQRELEDKKAEAARIIEALKTGDPDVAAENLKLLVEAGLVRESAGQIRTYLQNRKVGEGARLPAVSENPAASTPGAVWIVVIESDDTLEAAKVHAQVAKNAGYNDVQIYKRNGLFRTVINFPSKQEADSNLKSIQSKINSTSYPVNPDTWCLGPTPMSDHIECKGQ